MARSRTLLTVLGLAVGLSVGHARDVESPGSLREVIVVFKTHFDLGYTELAREVVERYRTSMIDRALAVCDAARRLPRDRRFVWTVPGWPMEKILWPGQAPDRRRRIERAIRDGLLVWHALPGSTHTESLDLEDLVRGLGFSSRLARRFDRPLPRDAKMTDVPSHAWVLPTLLRHAGVEFLHLGCNSGSASPDVPMLFWWEGPDGSRLLTFYAAGGYGSGLRPPASWPYGTWLALIHSGDNQGPPRTDAVEKLLAEAERDMPGVKVRMGRLSDFADAILREKAEIPVVRGDMPDTWIHGILSMPIESKIARNVRPALAGLEALNAMLRARGVAIPRADDAVAAAYEQSFLFGEHTWGASSRYYSPRIYGRAWAEARAEGKYDYAEASWREHGSYARELRRLAIPALEANVEVLARAVRVDGPRLVVFNPLPWERSGVVTIDAPATTSAAWKEAATGQAVPAALEAGKLRLLATGVPPLGYRTYVPAPPGDRRRQSADRAGSAPADPAPLLFQNRSFTLRLDPRRGGLASLVETSSGRELVDKTSKYALGQYLYERFNDDFHRAYLEAYRKHEQRWTEQFGKPGLTPAEETPYLAASPQRFQLAFHEDDVVVSARMTAPARGPIPHNVRITVTLPRDLPYVDLEWSVEDKEPDPWAEAGWLCFPLAVDEPAFRLGRLGAIVDPAADLLPGANHEVFCLSTGLTVTDGGGRGAGLCPIDSPLVSLGAPGLFRYTRAFRPRQPTVFVNLFNNVWGTNFQQWIGGSWSSRVRIWAVDRRAAKTSLITPSWEARARCLAAFGSGPAGTLPPADASIGLSRKGVLVTAFGSCQESGGLLLRLWEQAGEDGRCRVRLPGWLRVSQAQPCDLRGRPQGPPITIRDGAFDVTLRRFAPLSVILIGERAADADFRSQFLKFCDLAASEFDKEITPFADRNNADPATHHMPFFEDAHAVRALGVAYDMTGDRKYLDACRKWSDRMVAYQSRMIPRGAYYMNKGRAPGQDHGQWNVADSGSIGMGVLATAIRCGDPAEREMYLDSVKAFAELVMDNYIGSEGGISNGLWPAHSGPWWCSTATFGTLAFLLYDATGEEKYLDVAKGALDWLIRQDFREVRPITFEQRPSGIIFYCFELYATGLKYLKPGSPQYEAALRQIEGALDWMAKNQKTRGAAVPDYLERNVDMAGLPYLMYSFARQIHPHRHLTPAADQELRYIGDLLLGRGEPNVSRLMVWEVMTWGMLSYADRLAPGALQSPRRR